HRFYEKRPPGRPFMLLSPVANVEKLVFASKTYRIWGWSVIPLLGDLDSNHAKHPGIKWARCQRTLATESELEDWFLNQGFGGVGIVCGRVSRLVVLDFDDPALASEFRHLHPELSETRQVESGTRQLPHYYYHLPDNLQVYSHSVPGIDLRADG